MKLPLEFRTTLTLLLATSVVCTPARALVSFNGGRDHLYVTGTIGVGRDSNIFANNQETGDTVYTASLLAEYARKAGWIAVNASAEMEISKFSQNSGEDFSDPKFNLELMKQTGRTTGSLLLNAIKENRADPTINLRNESWTYGAALNVRYPVIDRYSLAGSLSYSKTDYVDGNLYVDLETYGASADLFYALNQERDLVVGYRYRDNESSVNTTTIDHALTVGVSGRIVRGYDGSLRFGYQYRYPRHSSDDTFSSWTGSASVTHSFGKKLSLILAVGKDFSTTATNVNIDRTNATADLQYVFNARWSANTGAGYTNTRFLGNAGRFGTGRSREDTMVNAHVGLGYSANEHFKLSVNYTWAKNWSTIPYSDFIRAGWSLNLVSRW